MRGWKGRLMWWSWPLVVVVSSIIIIVALACLWYSLAGIRSAATWAWQRSARG